MGVQDSGPWDAVATGGGKSRLFAQRTVRPLKLVQVLGKSHVSSIGLQKECLFSKAPRLLQLDQFFIEWIRFFRCYQSHKWCSPPQPPV